MTAPQIIEALSDLDYHSSPALSASGAKLILKSPAHYRWAMDHPTTSQTFNLGHAVHSLVLGGRQVVMLDADDYRSKEARERRDVYLDAGSIPLTRPEWQQVRAMADAVLSHPLAAALFSDGTPELSIFTTDPETGVALRSRPDWIGKDVVVDLKTTVNANPADFDRIAWTYHYEQQSAWYLDEVARAGIMPDEDRLLFVNVEKSPPYLVSVTELDAEALRIGRERNREAIDTFARCIATGEWPGYPAIEHLVPLPTYAAMQYAEEMH